MKRERLDTLNERDLLVGIIVSDKFCREIVPVLNPRLLEVEYVRIIAGWVKEFYTEYKQAPHRDIVKLCRSKCGEISDESLQENVFSFLRKLDDDYDTISQFNIDFALQEAVAYLKRIQLANLNADIESYLANGDVSKAENLIVKFRGVEKSSGKFVSVISNPEAVVSAFADEEDSLFSFKGAYGAVVGDIHREDFISYLAPMKRGKTWILIDAGINGMMRGLKVVHVSLEMSESQVAKRYWTAMSGQLSKDKDDIDYPFFEQDGEKWTVNHKTIARKIVSVAEIDKRQKQMRRMFRGGDIRILAVPAYSLTVEALDIELDKLQQNDNYIPDVIIVDYADIMMPSEKADYRNQLDGIWKRLRGMAQKRKAVVFTASQSGRASIGKNVDATDIAEDIRKLAHVTSMVSLNQTELEKKNGILRLKQLAVREGEQEFREAVCTQCLSIGRIITDSRFDNECDIELEEDDEEKYTGDRKKK